MSNIEVLAPVGSEEMLLAAVRSGADAVYLGAGDFNARRSAANFDEQQLKNAIKYCRQRGVKAYLTLNILIRDDEMSAAIDLARKAYLYGIDGIIVQDIGLAAVIKKAAPGLPLHASTQMSVHTPSALSLLKEMGFCRVVAAREMTARELECLCREATRLDMEVEVFVHGALCMCVSGQCVLSSMLGTRSGNRGLCAGPCRLPFTARGKSEDYALSLKDLSLIEHMSQLKGMGVASLKIEGRLKRPEYVAAATAAVSAAAHGTPDAYLNSKLQSVFSRSGFTDGYYMNRRDADMFGVRTKDDMEKSKAVMPEIHDLYRNERQRVSIDLSARIKAEEPVTLTVSDGENTVTVTGNIPQTAKSKVVQEEQISASLKKLGGTPFFAKQVDIILDEGLFVSNAEVNVLRRTAVEELLHKRGEVKRVLPEFALAAPDEIPTQHKGFIISVSDVAQLKNIEANGKIAAVILPLEKAQPIEALPGTEKWVDIPRGIESEEKITELLEAAEENGFCGAVCGNLSAIPLAKSAGLKIIAGTGLNIYNSYTANFFKELGADTAVLSYEMNIRDIKDIETDIKKAVVVYGRLPLMLLRNCPVKAQIGCRKCGGEGELTDRMGKTFPVKCRMGYAELFNCVPLCLNGAKDITCADYALLMFTFEGEKQVGTIVNGYLSKSVQPPTEFTRGLYYRSVE